MAVREKSTTEECLELLSPKEKAKYAKELHTLALLDLVQAAMEEDAESVQILAKIAGVSSEVAQTLLLVDKKDGFSLRNAFRALRKLGFKMSLELEDDAVPLKMSWIAD